MAREREVGYSGCIQGRGGGFLTCVRTRGCTWRRCTVTVAACWNRPLNTTSLSARMRSTPVCTPCARFQGPNHGRVVQRSLIWCIDGVHTLRGPRTCPWVRKDRNVVDGNARQAKALHGQAAHFGCRLPVVHRQGFGKFGQVGPARSGIRVWENIVSNAAVSRGWRNQSSNLTCAGSRWPLLTALPAAV